MSTLVDNCEGNQSEAARRMDVSPSFISNVLAGKGPDDPRSETWVKLQRALGIVAPPWMLAEGRAVYTALDRIDNFAQFVRALPPKLQESFFSLAEGLGWEDPGPPAGG